MSIPRPRKAQSTPPAETNVPAQDLTSRPGFWRRFARHRLALLGFFLLAGIILGCFAGPLFLSAQPDTMDLAAISQPPSRSHPFGTDELGRDVLIRALYGGRISIAVGVFAVAISTTIGVVLGAVAGFAGGRTDMVIMRLTDIMMAFPVLLLLIAVTPLLGAKMSNVILVLGFFGWPGICRVTRGQFLALGNEVFVEAAWAAGAGNWRIMLRHILPNAFSPLIVASTVAVAGAILTEAALSFLGLGIQPPTPTWGNMLNSAQSLAVLTTRPWQWLSPGSAIALTVLAINFIGEGLRDAIDPRWMSRKGS